MTSCEEIVIRWVRKLKRAVQKYGIVGLCGRLAEHVMRSISMIRPSVRAEIRERKRRAAEFDYRFGVDTVGCVSISDLNIKDPNQLYAKRYEGSDPKFFRDAMGVLPIDYRDFMFIDFGSGKGRAILLATEFPFKRIVGVEFSEKLHEIAQENIQRFRSDISKCKNVKSIFMDALQYPIPDDYLVCYFGDPFDEPLMAQMLAHIRESLLQKPREVFIVYYNPRSGHLFDQADCFKLVRAIGPVRIWRAAMEAHTNKA